MLRILTLLLAVLALLVGAAFSYFNAQPVQVDWLLGQSQLPLGVLLLGAMLGGFVLAMLLIGPAYALLAEHRHIPFINGSTQRGFTAVVIEVHLHYAQTVQTAL